uniref:bacterio-opsin activator domain-containing protein n=1 Tax=Haloprofundus sp. MHR1 TaxID=2572921 RepID=UPI001F3EC21C|nr:bacterio-opsin activator domain-containing protein [Haloprofundus sp. MHR1]
MSVIVEFTVADEEFILGQVLSNPPDMHIELERIVPTGSSVIPFLWVRGENYQAFEDRVQGSERVAELVVLDQLADEVLYRVEWPTKTNRSRFR